MKLSVCSTASLMTNIFSGVSFPVILEKISNIGLINALHTQAIFFIVASSAFISVHEKCFVIEQNGLKTLTTTRN